jgi:aspartate racemase
MDKGRCIGLLGGLGVGAAVHYYKKFAEAHDREHVSLDLVMVHAEAARIFEYAAADDHEGMARYLARFIDRLKAAGAEFAVIPAVTPHFCIRELLPITPLPVLNLFDSLTHELAARSLKRVSVFGTRFVIESALFGMANGVEVIQPRQDEMEFIHRTYVEIVQKGEGTVEQLKSLTQLALTLCKRDGAETIVLAGTDLALLFNENNIEFPYVDCAALHIEAILQKALQGKSLNPA